MNTIRISTWSFVALVCAAALPTADAACSLAGDYNCSGRVSGDDYVRWNSSFGSTDILAADGNADGIVDAADYTIWRDNFSASSELVPSSDAILQDAGADGTFDNVYDFNFLDVFYRPSFIPPFSGPLENRSALEFDLSGIDAPSSSVFLELSLRAENNGDDFVMEAHGYVGDGLIELTDAYEMNLLGAVSIPFGAADGSAVSYDVTDFVNALVADHEQYAGFLLKIPRPPAGTQAGDHVTANEEGSVEYWSRPRLVLAPGNGGGATGGLAAVPEPKSFWLLVFFGGFAPLAFRRR